MKPGGKLRAGRRPLKVEPKEQVLAKKAFHHLKILKKDIKKAKEFEVRKILRRIKQAKAEPDGKAGAAAGLDKLEAQLAAAKAADVEQLAARAARSCPVLMPTLQGSGQGQVAAAHQDEQPEPSAAAEAPPCSPQSVQQVVHARILGAKAVKDRLAEVQLEMQRVGEAASKRETAAAARTAPPAAATDAGGEAGEQAVPAGSKKRKERPAKLGTDVEGSGEEQEEVQQQVAKRHRQQQQAEGAGRDDVASGALAKLLGASMGRGPPAAAPGAAAAAAGGGDDSDDDSGIFQSASDDEQLLLSGGSSDAEEGGRLPSGAGGSDADSDDAAAVQHRQQQQAAAGVPGRGRSGQQQAKRGGDQPPQQQQQQQQKKKKEAPKSKNRLGQRARRLMAAMQYGRTAKHLQEPPPPQQGHDRPIPGQAALQVQRKPPPQQPASKDMASLHPSWAAKQAQKQKLQISIAGGSSPAKKIVFGDDGSQQHKPSAGGGTRPHLEQSCGGAHAIKPAAATTGKLHPSWEAKKRQQEQQKKMMLPAAGTKIVFGDDD